MNQMQIINQEKKEMCKNCPAKTSCKKQCEQRSVYQEQLDDERYGLFRRH